MLRCKTIWDETDGYARPKKRGERVPSATGRIIGKARGELVDLYLLM